MIPEGKHIYNLFILAVTDVNSANTWVGANQAYVKTSTSSQTLNNVVSSLKVLQYASSSLICSQKSLPDVFSGMFSKISRSQTLNYLKCGVAGIEYFDQVTIAPGLVVPIQSIGVATTVVSILTIDP